MAIKVQSKSKTLESLESRVNSGRVISIERTGGAVTNITRLKKGQISFDNNNAEIKKVMANHGISDKYENDQLFTKFTRFGVLDPKNTLLNTKEFVFITKPDLALLDTAPNSRSLNPVIANNANGLFVDAVRRYLPVMRQLQQSADESSPFMNMLSNSLTSTVDLPGISMDTVDSGVNVFGTKISYVGTPYKSDENHSFTLEFEDTKYLDVYMLFKLYAEYEKLKWNGALKFQNHQRWKNYVVNKVLHDQFSVYKFIVSDDGYRLLFWARLTGCYPTSVPRDAFSDTREGGPQKISVSFNSHFCREMDPIILFQFNQLVSKSLIGCRESTIFDYTNHMVNGEWPTIPYIYISDKQEYSHQREYYLRWGIK